MLLNCTVQMLLAFYSYTLGTYISLYVEGALLQAPITLCLRVFPNQEYAWPAIKWAGILELMVTGVTLNQCQVGILDTYPSFLVLE